MSRTAVGIHQRAESWMRRPLGRWGRGALLGAILAAPWVLFFDPIAPFATGHIPRDPLAIYRVYSDDFAQGSINPVVREIDRRNRATESGERLVRIHAVAFPAVFLMTGGDLFTGRDFAMLMRIICQRNGGTFVALPVIGDRRGRG